MTDKMRVLVVDDHEEFRHSLEALLGAMDNVEVVGRAGDGRRAVEMALDLQPDVVVMDLHMPQLNGVEATARIVQSSPHISVLVLTMMEDDDSVFAAVRAGARGYLLKGARRAEIRRAIEAVGAGEVIFGPGIAERVMTYFRHVRSRPSAQAFPDLTDRERQILGKIAEGLDNAEIARDLTLSVKTVRNHASNIFAKLHVAHRAQAIVLAREAGIENPGPAGLPSAAVRPGSRCVSVGSSPVAVRGCWSALVEPTLRHRAPGEPTLTHRRPGLSTANTRSRTSRRRRPPGPAAARAPRRGR